MEFSCKLIVLILTWYHLADILYFNYIQLYTCINSKQQNAEDFERSWLLLADIYIQVSNTLIVFFTPYVISRNYISNDY